MRPFLPLKLELVFKLCFWEGEKKIWREILGERMWIQILGPKSHVG